MGANFASYLAATKNPRHLYLMAAPAPAAAAASAASPLISVPMIKTSADAAAYAARCIAATKTPHQKRQMGLLAAMELIRLKSAREKNEQALEALATYRIERAIDAARCKTQEEVIKYISSISYAHFHTVEEAAALYTQFMADADHALQQVGAQPSVFADALRTAMAKAGFAVRTSNVVGGKRHLPTQDIENLNEPENIELTKLLESGQAAARAVRIGSAGIFGRTFRFPVTLKKTGAFDLLLVDGKPMPSDPEVLYRAAATSPYGDLKEAKTKIDSKVRDSREILADRLGFTTEGLLFMTNLTSRIRLDTEHHDDVLTVLKPYKLIVYGPGGHFKEHLDTPHPDTVGTVIISFPFKRSGGDLKVRYGGKEFDDSASANGENLVVSMFNANCPHEVTRVTSGYRVSLSFFMVKESSIAEHPYDDVDLLYKELAKRHNLGPIYFERPAPDKKSDEMLELTIESMIDAVAISTFTYNVPAFVEEWKDADYNHDSADEECEPTVPVRTARTMALLVRLFACQSETFSFGTTIRKRDSSHSGADEDFDDDGDDDCEGLAGHIESSLSDEPVKDLCDVVRKMCIEHGRPAAILLGWMYAFDECKVHGWKDGDGLVIDQFTEEDRKMLDFDVVPVIVSSRLNKPYDQPDEMDRGAVFRSTREDLIAAMNDDHDRYAPLEAENVIFFATNHGYGKTLYESEEESVEHTGNESRDGFEDMIYQNVALVVRPKHVDGAGGAAPAASAAAAGAGAGQPAAKKRKAS